MSVKSIFPTGRDYMVMISEKEADTPNQAQFSWHPSYGEAKERAQWAVRGGAATAVVFQAMAMMYRTPAKKMVTVVPAGTSEELVSG